MQELKVRRHSSWSIAMAKPLLTDALWERIRSLIPPPPKPKRPDRPGRKRIDDRRCLIGILFVLKTGIDWEDLPQEMGCGCGMTCWRRLAYWTKAGVWPKLHELLLAELEGAGKIDWRRATIDTSHVRARGGGEKTGPSPVDRRKKGSKHFVVTDAQGIPLAATTTAGNYPDVKENGARRRRGAASPGQAGTAQAAAQGDVRRSWVRLGSELGRDAAPEDPAADRPGPGATRQRPGQAALGRRADAVVVAQFRSTPGA
jgi:transposase